ncbi:MAG: heme ABC transporter permease [Rickettsiales bacterium]
MFHSLANPARFIRITDKLFPLLSVLLFFLLIFGLAEALIISPSDWQQGETVRIMYVHVPAAWLALMVYSIMAFSSAGFLIWRHPLADIAARSSAPLGAAFTLIALITGSIWGKPMWGTWWEWEARLTSVLVLFFMYIGYIALSDSYATQEKGKKICAIMALVGFVNIPIIHFSVEWWNTLHQPASVIRQEGNAIDPSMRLPLYSMALSFVLIYFLLVSMRIKTMVIKQKIRRLRFR